MNAGNPEEIICSLVFPAFLLVNRIFQTSNRTIHCHNDKFPFPRTLQGSNCRMGDFVRPGNASSICSYSMKDAEFSRNKYQLSGSFHTGRDKVTFIRHQCVPKIVVCTLRYVYCGNSVLNPFYIHRFPSGEKPRDSRPFALSEAQRISPVSGRNERTK